MPFTSWELNFEQQLVTIELSDGQRQSFPMPEVMAAAGVPFLRSTFDFTSNTLSFTAASGGELIVEVGAASAPDDPPAGRPVVYLDQLHWVSLARQRHAPEKLNEATASAATTLIQLAEAQRIVLPLSAGHLAEMAHLEGRWREHLGLTIMTLARGWQMRNPVAVRKAEFVLAMRGESPRARGVFTLEPEVLFAASEPSGPATHLPRPFDDLLPRLTWTSAVYAAVLDDEAVDMREGHEAAERWAADFPRLAQYMREHKMSAEHARMNTRAGLIADLGDETALAGRVAGLTPERFSTWLREELPPRLREMPYVGRLHEVLYHRLRNADEKWERKRPRRHELPLLCRRLRRHSRRREADQRVPSARRVDLRARRGGVPQPASGGRGVGAPRRQPVGSPCSTCVLPRLKPAREVASSAPDGKRGRRYAALIAVPLRDPWVLAVIATRARE